MKKQPEVQARTRQKLIDAFFELGKDKKISQITVGELARLAGYNRSTFYEYFLDMPDLIRQAEEDLLAQIRENISQELKPICHADLDASQSTFRFFFQMLNEPMYCLMGPNGDPSFFSKVKDMLFSMLSRMPEMEQVPTNYDYIIAFVYSGAIGYLQHWHTQGKSMPEQELFDLGYRLISRGALDVLAATAGPQGLNSHVSGQEQKK